MLKKWLIPVIVVTLCGCVTVKTPTYIKDPSKYKKEFFASYEKTLEAVQQALEDNGWKISGMTDPGVYEQQPTDTTGTRKQILIFTEVRQTPLILLSRFMNLNVYLRTTDTGTEVEIRYSLVTSMLVRNTYSSTNDAVVNKILNRIGEILAE